MRKVIERYLVADKSLSIYPSGRAIFLDDASGYGLNGILDNQIVIYNADTGVSVGAGITYTTVPRLVIAQGIDTNGDGIADVLRKPPFDFIDAMGISAVTADPPSCGAIKILDVGIGCVKRGETYSLTIETRSDETENYYSYNDYERHTETVIFDWDDCGDCDQPLDCKEVACALANKFKGRDGKSSPLKNGSLIRKLRAHQAKDRNFDVYVLHANDYEFCFATPDAACVGCNQIDAITGITIDGVTTNFNLTTVPGDATKTAVGQVDRIVKKIHDLLDANNIGSAVRADTFIGSGKPCCDGVKILINSCKTIVLLGEGGDPITPCATGLPTYSVNTSSECGGCGSVTTTTPCAYLRVIPRPIKLEKFCDGPDDYKKTLYTDVRVVTSANHNHFGFFKVFTKQDYEIPSGLAYQLLHDVMLQDTSGNEPFSYGYNEFVGKYSRPLKGSRMTEMLHGLLGKGCESSDGFAIVNIEHSANVRDFETQGNLLSPKVRTTVLVPVSNTAFKTEFEAIINPWLVSIPGKGFKTISLTTDQDQIERVLNPDTTVLTAEYPNSNGHIIGN